MGEVIPEIVLLAGAVVVLITPLFTPQCWQHHAPWLSLVVIGAAVAATVPQLGDAQRIGFFETYALDGTAVVGKLIVLLVAAVSVGLSAEWFRSDHRAGELQTMLLFATLGAVLLAGAADLMELVLGTAVVLHHRLRPGRLPPPVQGVG